MSNSDEMERVLVVEDDENITQLLEFMMERMNFQPVMIADGRAAAEYITSQPPPTLVLLDVMLPYHDGFALVAMIRARAEWATVPVLMLTARSHERDIVRALDAGANDYVLKPFQPQELMARVKRLLPRVA